MADQLTVSRRTAVKALVGGAAALAVGAYIVPVASAHAQDGSFNSRNKQYGFLVKPQNCANCGACVRACNKHNQITDETLSRRRITAYQQKGGDTVYVSTSCMHCVEPACMTVCPAGAIGKTVGGIVEVDKNRCIGCKYCYQACPFGVPRYTHEAMDKCDCCVGAGVKPGDETWCARACKFGALRYGLIDDLLKECPEAVVVEASTKPAMLMA